MDDGLKQHLTEKGVWRRALYMLLFIVIYWVVEIVVIAVVILQFLLNLFTGKKNNYLLEFGQDLSRYIYQILLFLTYNSEELAFPFSAWPSGNGDEKSLTASSKKKTKKKSAAKGKSDDSSKADKTDSDG